MKYALLFTALSAVAFGSCTRTTTVTCTPGWMTMYGLGFTTAELDSSISYSYKADGLFDSVIDSTYISVEPGNGDTAQFYYLRMTEGTDYIILIPDAGLQYRVTRITQNNLIKETFTYTPNAFSGNNYYCVNWIGSCEINGTACSPTAPSTYQGTNNGYYYPNGSAVYIHK